MAKSRRQFVPISKASKIYINVDLHKIRDTNISDARKLEGLVREYGSLEDAGKTDLERKEDMISLKSNINSMGDKALEIKHFCKLDIEEIIRDIG